LLCRASDLLITSRDGLGRSSWIDVVNATAKSYCGEGKTE
jgi:hypothetical protein